MGAKDRGAGRPELIEARKRQGMSQEEAAEAIGVSATTWGRWERGSQGIRAVYRARMVAVFDVGVSEVARWIDGDRALCPAMGYCGRSLADTVEAVKDLWRSEVHPSRREILTALPFVPAAMGESLAAWSYDPPLESVAHRGSGPRVGISDVTRVDDARRAFAQIDHQFGAGLVRPVIVNYLNGTVAPLLQGRYDERVGAALMTA